MKTFLLLLAVGIVLAIGGPAGAVTCGPGQTHTTCQCGDTVAADYVLPANLSCPTGHGLLVSSGVTLSCNDLTISGGGGTDTYGVYLNGTTFAKVKRCVVSGFDRGIRLNGASYSQVATVTATGNGNFTTHVGYGIDLAGASSWNLLNKVTVYNNADEGVHIGSSADGNVVIDSTVCGNFRESMYVLSADENLIANSTLGGTCFGFSGGGTGTYVKNAIGTRFSEVTFAGGSTHVTGASYGTFLLHNTYINGATYVEDCYDPDGTCPAYTKIIIP